MVFQLLSFHTTLRTFAPLKSFIANRIIHNKAKASSKRPRKVRSLEKGVKLGVLFYADTEKKREMMRQFREELKSANVEITLLGFVPEKDFPSNLVFKPGFDYFHKKELKWWNGLLNDTKVKQFQEIPLDYLVVATEKPQLPLLHLAAGSKAGFRIGPHFTDYSDCFDFMVSQGDYNDLKSYLKTVEHYLKQFRHD